MGKEFMLTYPYRMLFNFDTFNIFNHPDFDAPNHVTFFANYGPQARNPVAATSLRSMRDP